MLDPSVVQGGQPVWLALDAVRGVPTVTDEWIQRLSVFPFVPATLVSRSDGSLWQALLSRPTLPLESDGDDLEFSGGFVVIDTEHPYHVYPRALFSDIDGGTYHLTGDLASCRFPVLPELAFHVLETDDGAPATVGPHRILLQPPHAQVASYGADIAFRHQHPLFSGTGQASSLDIRNQESRVGVDSLPHLYDTSTAAYTSLVRDDASQVIFVEGVSGSGKTYAYLHMTQHLLYTSSAHGTTPSTFHHFYTDPAALATTAFDIHTRADYIMCSALAVNAMVGCKNNGSLSATRAAVALHLQYDDYYQICGAKFSVKMLDHYRIGNDSLPRTYDLLYALLHAPDSLLASVYLERGHAYKYLFPAGHDGDRTDPGFQRHLDGNHWKAVWSILQRLPERGQGFLQIMGAILLLGELEFLAIPGEAAKPIDSNDNVEKICSLLQISVPNFHRILALDRGQKDSERNVTKLANHLYSVAIEWFTGSMNAILQASQPDALQVSLVDFPGLGSESSAGQMTCNFAREVYTDTIIDLTISEPGRFRRGYEPGVSQVPDRRTIRAVFSQRDSAGGILNALDHSDGDAGMFLTAATALQAAMHGQIVETVDMDAITINHSPFRVKYSARNAHAISTIAPPPLWYEVLSSCGNATLASIVQSLSSRQTGHPLSSHPLTTLQYLENAIGSVLGDIPIALPFIVTSLLDDRSLSVGSTMTSVVGQLRQSAVVPATYLERHGLTHSLEPAILIQEFGHTIDPALRSDDDTRTAELVLSQMFPPQVFDIIDGWIYLSNSAWRMLTEERALEGHFVARAYHRHYRLVGLTHCATNIQKIWRGHSARKRYRRTCRRRQHSARVLQRFFKLNRYRMAVLKTLRSFDHLPPGVLENAAVTFQRWWRGAKGRENAQVYIEQVVAATVIQHAYLTRFYHRVLACVRIQRAWRRWLSVRAYKWLLETTKQERAEERAREAAAEAAAAEREGRSVEQHRAAQARQQRMTQLEVERRERIAQAQASLESANRYDRDSSGVIVANLLDTVESRLRAELMGGNDTIPGARGGEDENRGPGNVPEVEPKVKYSGKRKEFNVDRRRRRKNVRQHSRMTEDGQVIYEDDEDQPMTSVDAMDELDRRLRNRLNQRSFETYLRRIETRFNGARAREYRRQQYLDSKLNECTHTPRINRRSLALADKRGVKPVTERLYEQQAKTQEKINAMRASESVEDMSEYTFTPRLSEYANTTTTTMQERNVKYDERREAKYAAVRAEQEARLARDATFQPHIDEQSRGLVFSTFQKRYEIDLQERAKKRQDLLVENSKRKQNVVVDRRGRSADPFGPITPLPGRSVTNTPRMNATLANRPPHSSMTPRGTQTSVRKPPRSAKTKTHGVHTQDRVSSKYKATNRDASRDLDVSRDPANAARDRTSRVPEHHSHDCGNGLQLRKPKVAKGTKRLTQSRPVNKFSHADFRGLVNEYLTADDAK